MGTYLRDVDATDTGVRSELLSRPQTRRESITAGRNVVGVQGSDVGGSHVSFISRALVVALLDSFV
jgi:hypothetical protein